MLKTAVGVTALVALMAGPPLAAAETVVPPGNSAATQYTETFPTTGGNAEVNSSIGGGGGGKNRTPAKVLGTRTAHSLEQHGQEGRTVAALATESAPESESQTGGAAGTGGNSGGGQTPSGGGKGNGSPGSGGGSAGRQGTQVPPSAGGVSLAKEAPSGNSGLGEIFSQATASSSGTMGIFLPLVLILALLWAIAYEWRQHRQGQAAS